MEVNKDVINRKYGICHTYSLYNELNCLYCPYYDKCDRNKKKDKEKVIERSIK